MFSFRSRSIFRSIGLFESEPRGRGVLPVQVRRVCADYMSGYFLTAKSVEWVYFGICTDGFNRIHHRSSQNGQELSKISQFQSDSSVIIKKVSKTVIIVRKCYQKSVDMGLKLEENMYGWVGFFISGPHTPINFLIKYPPLGIA